MNSLNSLLNRANELWQTLRDVDPYRLAEYTGAIYEPSGSLQGCFRLEVFDREVCLGYPGFDSVDQETGQELDNFTYALLAYYFATSNGVPQAGRWISFNELPDGMFYARAFQGYTGDELAKEFLNDMTAFADAAKNAGGHPERLGDCAFSFQVLPRISILVVCWMGDEDFPPSYRILFDASAGYHLTTDALAVLCSSLTRRIIKSRVSHE